MHLPRIHGNASYECVQPAQNIGPPSSTSFVLLDSTSEPRSTELVISELHSSLYVSKIYRENFYDYVRNLDA